MTTRGAILSSRYARLLVRSTEILLEFSEGGMRSPKRPEMNSRKLGSCAGFSQEIKNLTVPPISPSAVPFIPSRLGNEVNRERQRSYLRNHGDTHDFSAAATPFVARAFLPVARRRHVRSFLAGRCNSPLLLKQKRDRVHNEFAPNPNSRFQLRSSSSVELLQCFKSGFYSERDRFRQGHVVNKRN